MSPRAMMVRGEPPRIALGGPGRLAGTGFHRIERAWPAVLRKRVERNLGSRPGTWVTDWTADMGNRLRHATACHARMAEGRIERLWGTLRIGRSARYRRGRSRLHARIHRRFQPTPQAADARRPRRVAPTASRAGRDPQLSLLTGGGPRRRRPARPARREPARARAALLRPVDAWPISPRPPSLASGRWASPTNAPRPASARPRGRRGRCSGSPCTCRGWRRSPRGSRRRSARGGRRGTRSA